MNNNLNQILKRIARLEAAVFNSGEPRHEKRVRSSGRKSLPDYILDLQKSGFFKQPKTAREAHAKLQSVYACDLARVETALPRLSKRKLLRVTSKEIEGKKFKAYAS